MKRENRILKARIHHKIKHIKEFANNINFLTEIDNIFSHNEKEQFHYEKKTLHLNKEEIKKYVNNSLIKIIENNFKKKESNLFFDFFNNLIKYLYSEDKNYKKEYEILNKYSLFIQEIKINYKKNFNELILFLNKSFYIKQVGFK